MFSVFHEMLPESKLLLIGTGSMHEEIKKKVNEVGLDSAVSFLGNRKDVAELYMAMDVFAFPSSFEGFGIVGVEAQATGTGTPCVCTDTLLKEISVTPLLYRIPLKNGVGDWAKKIVEAEKNCYAHSDMKQYIVDANYDMCTVVGWLEDYYLKRSRK